MRRMIDYADELEALARYVRQDGNNTEVGGNMEVDGHLMVNGKGMDQAEYDYKYYVEYIDFEYTIHSSSMTTIDIHMKTNPFVFYSNTQMTELNKDAMMLAVAQDLALTGSAMLQQVTTGTATITRYGIFATHIDDISVILIDGTSLSAANYSYENMDFAYDCRNLTEGITFLKYHN